MSNLEESTSSTSETHKRSKGMPRTDSGFASLDVLISGEPSSQKWISNRISGTDEDEEKKSVARVSEVSTINGAQPEQSHRQWGSKLDFVMSGVSYAVGLGNIWRFPFKCYKDGGGAFLIPYIICWFLLGVPMFFLEVSVAQYIQKGSLGVWKLVPMLRGVGYATVTIAAMLTIYYAVIIGWAFLYLFTSMQPTLPWKECDHYWNDVSTCVNYSSLHDSSMDNITKMDNMSTSVIQYWKGFVLQQSDGIDEAGTIVWYVFLCVLLGWLIVYFVVWRGLHSAGKIVWVSAIFPYIIIIILLGRAASLDGAREGIEYYITPNITMLTQATTWVDAATQILYSYGIGLATLFALGCYNDYNHNCQRDTLMIGVINACTSLLAGFVVFASLGYMARQRGVPISQVAEAGPGLVFITYPAIFLEMVPSQLWSIVFFIMILVLGIDSEFCQVEGVLAGLEDIFPGPFRKHKKKLTALVCFVMFLLAFPMMTQGGIYIFELVDTMACSGPPLLWVVFWEAVGFTWIFGVKRIYKGLDHMMGKKTFIRYSIYWWGTCWVVIIPLLCIGIFVFNFILYKPLSYESYTYPTWGQALGWCMSAGSMAMVPLYAIYYIIKTPGTLRERFRKGITPSCPLPAEMIDDNQSAYSADFYNANITNQTYKPALTFGETSDTSRANKF